MEWIVGVWYGLLFSWLFVVGSAIGSFLNVCIYRLPRSKNLLWPSSRCGSCYTPIPLYHNIPLVSYWWLRGRCRRCGVRFSMRYFWVEFLTGLVFAGLYALVIGLNVLSNPAWPRGGFAFLDAAQFPPHSWPFFAGQAILACLLLVAAGCLLEYDELPTALVVTGVVLGLGWALLGPWHDLGNALAGLLLTPWLMRLAQRFHSRHPFTHAPQLLLMTGAFIGGQASMVALALACALAPLLRLLPSIKRPFALALWLGILAAWLAWPWLARLISTEPLPPLWSLLALLVLAGTLVIVGFVLPRPRPARQSQLVADKSETVAP